jgi:hypothetical protein
MNNLMCHNGRKVIEEFDNRKLQRVAHPPYSPDLSPCDFWLFGMLKQKMKDREFSGVEEIMKAVQEIWREVTLERLQSIFFNWIGRLEYVIEHDGEDYNTHIKRLSQSLSYREIAGGQGTFWTPYNVKYLHVHLPRVNQLSLHEVLKSLVHRIFEFLKLSEM